MESPAIVVRVYNLKTRTTHTAPPTHPYHPANRHAQNEPYALSLMNEVTTQQPQKQEQTTEKKEISPPLPGQSWCAALLLSSHSINICMQHVTGFVRKTHAAHHNQRLSRHSEATGLASRFLFRASQLTNFTPQRGMRAWISIIVQEVHCACILLKWCF